MSGMDRVEWQCPEWIEWNRNGMAEWNGIAESGKGGKNIGGGLGEIWYMTFSLDQTSQMGCQVFHLLWFINLLPPTFLKGVEK